MVVWHPARTMGVTLAPMLVAGGMGAAEPPTPLAVLMLMKAPGVVDGARMW